MNAHPPPFWFPQPCAEEGRRSLRGGGAVLTRSEAFEIG